MNSENVFLCICKLWIEFSTTVAQHLFSTTKLAMLHTRGGGGTLDFKWRGWLNGAKSQDPKKSLDQKLTPKKSHADFVALKSSRKG